MKHLMIAALALSSASAFASEGRIVLQESNASHASLEWAAVASFGADHAACEASLIAREAEYRRYGHLDEERRWRCVWN